MLENKNEKYEKYIAIFLGIIIIFMSIFVPTTSKLSGKQDSQDNSVAYYDANSEKAVFIAGGINSSNAEMSYISNWLFENGISVAFSKYDNDYKSFENGLDLLQKNGFEKEDIAVLGYDIGGYYLLNRLSNEDEKYAGAVLISPFYKYFDVSSVPVDNTSYVNNIDWLKEVSPKSLNQPTSIITTTLDDIASPALCTIIYNHVSGDDILISSNRYSATKNGVELNVVSGGNHVLSPHSKLVINHVRGFLQENLDVKLDAIGGQVYMSVIFFNILPLALLFFVVMVYVIVRFKFTSISYSVNSYRGGKSAGVLLRCVFGTILASPIAYFIYKILGKLNFSNSAQVIFLSYMFSFSVVMLAMYKFSSKAKIVSAVQDIDLAPSKKVTIVSIGLFLFLLLFLSIQSLTGFIIKPISVNILTLVITFAMAFLTFYVAGIEADLLRVAKLPVTTNVVYYLIRFIPYILLLLWNMFMSRHTAAMLYYRYTVLFAVALMAGRTIIEISGHRKMSATMMAILYTVSILCFSVLLI